MRRRSTSLSPGWAKLAANALRCVDGAAGAATGRGSVARVLKAEVRRGRGCLRLLYLVEPEDASLVRRLRHVAHCLARTSTVTCEECGRTVPSRDGQGGDVLCRVHQIPF